PEGGSGGGRILATGTPEEIAACKESYTGRALRKVLGVESPVSRVQSPVKASKQNHTRHSTLDTRHASTLNAITIKGASQHNLQSVDVTIPRDRMSVFCGPSGSGKTSLAMDTLYA